MKKSNFEILTTCENELVKHLVRADVTKNGVEYKSTNAISWETVFPNVDVAEKYVKNWLSMDKFTAEQYKRLVFIAFLNTNNEETLNDVVDIMAEVARTGAFFPVAKPGDKIYAMWFEDGVDTSYDIDELEVSECSQERVFTKEDVIFECKDVMKEFFTRKEDAEEWKEIKNRGLEKEGKK